MNESVIKEIVKIGYNDLWDILLAYASQLMKSRGGSVMGAQPKDLVSQSIEKILKSEWEQSQGDLIACIKHEIFNGYRRMIRKKEYTQSTEVDTFTIEVNSRDESNQPDSVLESLQGIDEIYSIVRQKKKDDTDKVEEVLEAMEAGYQNIDIADLVGVSIKEVENYKRRIRRYLSDKKPRK